MNKTAIVVLFLAVIICFNSDTASAQVTSASMNVETRTLDVNKDGKLDVTYYKDGKYVSKIEADTNYDGKSDVTVHLKDGSFKSAQADTDYDGKPDKEFTNAAEFNKWMKEKNPDFQDNLNRPDWQFDLLKF